MRFGFAVPAYGSHANGPEVHDLLGRRGRAGFDSAWFPDHIAVPDYAAAVNLPPPFLEPLSACAWGLGDPPVAFAWDRGAGGSLSTPVARGRDDRDLGTFGRRSTHPRRGHRLPARGVRGPRNCSLRASRQGNGRVPPDPALSAGGLLGGLPSDASAPVGGRQRPGG